jgi:hypothetical protein
MLRVSWTSGRATRDLASLADEQKEKVAPERSGKLIVPHNPSPTSFDHLREIGRELARALRTAAKRPTFSLVAIATLGIGIGASTATFSIADAVLMRPLPVHEQRKL